MILSCSLIVRGGIVSESEVSSVESEAMELVSESVARVVIKSKCKKAVGGQVKVQWSPKFIG